ncbi:hypothetical protein PQX77_021363 [Marasmius sp. AFHP31]|nr:hypothetical protein PQX77_021363 [Marasmius sp. AFHP31]
MLFSNVGLQVLSSLIYLLGLTTLAHCISRRLLTSWSSHWLSFLVLMIFVVSWLFLFSSGMLVFGVGLETTTAACHGAIVTCVVLYTSSKVLIYLFLSEKVFLVWSVTAVGGRFRSPVYLLCLGTMLGYLVIFILMIRGRIHFWRDDGACVIGLKAFSSIPLLVYDLYLTFFLNGLFLWPICRSNIQNPRFKRAAIRTLVASAAASVASAVNIGALTFQHGRQLGWVCLGSCGTDVILNAIAIFWVTNANSETELECPTLNTQSPRPRPRLGCLSLNTFLRTRPKPQDRSLELPTELTTPTISRFLSSNAQQESGRSHAPQVMVVPHENIEASANEECLDANGQPLKNV